MSDVERIAQIRDHGSILSDIALTETDPAIFSPTMQAHRTMAFYRLAGDVPALLAALARRDAAIQAVQDMCVRANAWNRGVTHDPDEDPAALVAANRVLAAIAAELEKP